MISLEGVEWAVNGKQEILVWLELPEVSETPTSLVLSGRTGYVVFGNSGVARTDIPKEILDLFDAASNILVVSAHDGVILNEKHVPILRA